MPPDMSEIEKAEVEGGSREVDATDHSKSGHGWGEHLLSRIIASQLDSESWEEHFEPSDEEVKKANRKLTEVLWDLATPLVWGVSCLFGLLLLLDYATSLNPQVYGLFFNIWAGVCFVFPDLRSPVIIASIVESEEDAVRHLEAETMTSTNAGFVMLMAGFTLQMASVQFLDGEILTQNVLGAFPAWMMGIALLGVGYGSVKIFGFFRERKLDRRDRLN